jgi:hypothetical protein
MNSNYGDDTHTYLLAFFPHLRHFQSSTQMQSLERSFQKWFKIWAMIMWSTSWHSSSGLRGHRRTYRTTLEWADHALFKMVRYVLLRPLTPDLDGVKISISKFQKQNLISIFFLKSFFAIFSQFIYYFFSSKNHISFSVLTTMYVKQCTVGEMTVFAPD